MKNAAEAIQGMIGLSVEAPVHADQREVETKLLATMAAVINSDQELKFELLSIDAVNFHFGDHFDVFVAMKSLADAGEHVDSNTVRAAMGDAWKDAMKDIFDASMADPAAAMAYKRQIVFWTQRKLAMDIGRNFMAKADQANEADLPKLIADLQKAVFDMGRTDFIAPPVKTEAELTDRFLLDLAKPNPGYKTGFDRMEKVILRGIPPGLFVIAAPPSAGKTTFVKQLADQVAEHNQVPVLFFSFEQSADELRIKSLARLSKLADNPVDNESIKQGSKADRVAEAAKEYKRFAHWIKVIEGDRQTTVDRIRIMAQREKMKTGKAPFLVIDYLQILPNDEQQDKRAAVDVLVSDLRRIARDIGTPIIAISSMSRAEYDRAKMSAFKESGGIEYGADIAAILTVEKENEDGTERTIDLKIIKNRNGRRGCIGMNYDMRYDLFCETANSALNYCDTVGREENK